MIHVLIDLCSNICHNLPSRTYELDGNALPLCARCTGVYTGFMLTLLWIVCSRSRNCTLIPKRLLWMNISILATFALLGFGGVYGVVSLSKWQRLMVGSFFGSALALFIWPVTAQWVLRIQLREWTASDKLRYAVFLIFLIILPLGVNTGSPLIYYILITLSISGLVLANLTANALLIMWLADLDKRTGIVWRVACTGGSVALLAVEFEIFKLWRMWWEVA